MDNPLDRYASHQMAQIWSDSHRHTTMRRIWHHILREQTNWLDFGLDPDQLAKTLDAYRTLSYEVTDRTIARINLAEHTTGHDIKAAINTYNRDTANHLGYDPHDPPPQLIHHGLTSHDIVDNTTQALIRQATQRIHTGTSHLLDTLYTWDETNGDTPTIARTHNQPAQPTTLGHRTATWIAELEQAHNHLGYQLDHYRLRGLRGAIGDSQDLTRILAPHTKQPHRAIRAIEESLAHSLRFVNPDGQPLLAPETGQIYPRSYDLPLASALYTLTAPCTTIAITFRLMSGHRQTTEIRRPDQTGSTAMAHKTNPILAERIHALTTAARGYHQMLLDTAGEQWYEGDISTSAVRRIAWPGLTTTIDAILATTEAMLHHTRINRDALADDYTRNSQAAATGAILHAMVQTGTPREQAHHIIARNARHAGDLRDHLLNDPEFPLSTDHLDQIIADTQTGGDA